MDTLVAIDEAHKQNPSLDLAQLTYSYEYHHGNGFLPAAEELKAKIMSSIQADNMLPYYEKLTAKFSWDIEEELAKTMR